MQEKGKRKIVDSPKGDQRCKMKEDPIIMKADLKTKAKRK